MPNVVPLIAVDSTQVVLIHDVLSPYLNVLHPRGTSDIPLTPEQAEILSHAAPDDEHALHEIERKFIVDRTPPLDLTKYDCSHITQGYVVAHPQASVRIRSSKQLHKLNIKHGKGLKRVEVEIKLTSSSAEKLWLLAGNKRLEKTRYIIPGQHENPMELDIYHGLHDGLIVLEQEFATIEEAETFVPPLWVGKEVTDDPKYTNAELARLAESSASTSL
ncbi:MAG: CYTH domain-containing protein [Myxococcales bacterium]|nr:CYTH domain-containing protein [Myxococcales bacterium]